MMSNPLADMTPDQIRQFAEAREQMDRWLDEGASMTEAAVWAMMLDPGVLDVIRKRLAVLDADS
jgi:hypothetical protein